MRTVLSLRSRLSAIRLLLRPSTTSSRTWSSRRVRAALAQVRRRSMIARSGVLEPYL